MQTCFGGAHRTPGIDPFIKHLVRKRIEDFWTDDLNRPRNAKYIDFAAAVFDELEMPYERSSLRKLLS